MPVLVSVVCRQFQAIPVLGLFTVCMFACALAFDPAIVLAQSSILETVPANNGQSVFDLADDSPASKAPTFRAAANGVASIDDEGPGGQSTFTSRPQTDGAPSVPSSLLVPRGPTEDDYTPEEQFDLRTNGLRGERIPLPRGNSVKSKADAPFTQSSQSFGDPSGNSRARGVGSGGPESPFAQSSRSIRSQNPAQYDTPMVRPAGQFDQPVGQINNQTTSDVTSQSFGDSPRNSGRVRSRIENPFGGPTEQASQPMTSQPPPSVRFNEPISPMNRLSSQTPQNISSQNRQPVLPQNFSQPINSGLAPLNSVTVQGSYNSPIPSQGSINSSVQPTGFNQLAQPKTVDTKLAKTLMAKYIINETNPNLPGTAVELIEVLRQTVDINQRRPMVSQYWEAYYDWATLVNAQEFSLWLGRLNAGRSPAQQAVLESAQLEARSAVLAAEIQLGKSQSLLTQYMPNQPAEYLPLPSDKPLIVKYRTEYEKYKYFQMMPVSLRGIDQILPKQLQLIADRASTVQVAKSAAHQMATALGNNQTTLRPVLAAAQDWRVAERKLISSVTSYNQAIGDYALTVAQGYQTPESVAAMLVAPKTTPPSGLQNNQRQAQGSTGNQFGQSNVTNQNFQNQNLQNQAMLQRQAQAQVQTQQVQRPTRPFGGSPGQSQVAGGARNFGSQQNGQQNSQQNTQGNPPVRSASNQPGGQNNSNFSLGQSTPANSNLVPNTGGRTNPNAGAASALSPNGFRGGNPNAPVNNRADGRAPQGPPPTMQGSMEKGAYNNALPPIRAGGFGNPPAQFGPQTTQGPAARTAQGFGSGIR